MSLTPGGRALKDNARLVLENAAALHGSEGKISGTVTGPIRIGCLNTLAPLLLASLPRKLRRYILARRSPSCR